MPEANDTMSVGIAVRTNFAVTHLLAAAQAAGDAYAVEQANATAEFGPWFDEMMRLVPIAVVMAGAALEANANELIQDFLDRPSGISSARRVLLKDLKDELSGNAINKHRRLALLLDKEPDTESVPWENATLLVKFRNSFMRFKPPWDYEDIHSGKLVSSLKNKVPVVSSWKGQVLFPHGYMTYACAKWSVQSVLAFSREFSALLGVIERFAAGHLNFSLP